MRPFLIVILALGAAAAAGCGGGDTRDWMKVNQKYTKEEFQRDYRECGRDEKTFESCMRQRGWVPVSPSKQEAPKTDPGPRERRY